MRADRLLSILLLLQVHRRMTAGDLAERLEVSERTIHRDMESLGAAGIPVYAERGARGGWRLLEPYRTNLTGLSEPEAQALFLGTPTRLLSDLGLDRAAEGAFVKLLAALPSMARQGAEQAQQRIYVDTAGWSDAEEAVPSLPLLQEAVWSNRKLQLTYRRNDAVEVERLVSPLGLVAKGSVWYLVAAVEEGIRTYRVSRVLSAQITDETFDRPADFDLAVHWKRSSADFKANLPRYPTVLRVHPRALANVRRPGLFAHLEHEALPDPDGWVRVAMRFDVEGEACRFVLGLGPEVEVIEPRDLRDKVCELARSIVDLYTHHGGARSQGVSRSVPGGGRSPD